MRLLHGPVRRDPDMKLGELVGAAGPRPEIMESGQFRIFLRGREESLPKLGRPFLVHELVERVTR